MNKPLEGVLVVALEQAVAAPMATRHLADLGARVVKIERPEVGDFARYYDKSVRGLSSHFVWLNRSKESLALDLKQPQALAILEKLLAKADVLVQNLAPGALDRLGFPAAALRARFPRLIVCGISGYGVDGPYHDKKAYDLLLQAESGLLSITGAGDVPVKAGIAIADIAAGMYAFSGILTALYQRQHTGIGATLDVSMLEALGEWMGYPAYFTSYGGTAPARSGAHHATIAPYGPFTLRDDKILLIGIQNEREWAAFCEQVLHQPEIAQDPRFCANPLRVKHRDALESLVQAAFSRMTIDQAVAALEQSQIAYGQMRTMREFLEHPQLAARGRWRSVDSPAGPLWALQPPGLPEGTEPVFGAIPEVGQHTEAILCELGFDEPGSEHVTAMSDPPIA
jgi:itaconate CoA-transferase